MYDSYDAGAYVAWKFDKPKNLKPNDSEKDNDGQCMYIWIHLLTCYDF